MANISRGLQEDLRRSEFEEHLGKEFIRSLKWGWWMMTPLHAAARGNKHEELATLLTRQELPDVT